ncbi:LuxR C-terminal-related transcriptional regulator [Amycolatopsis rubida]|uniref:Non-specific serine/threonine protein kinase n=1 Tax=Amycolatopsis rubida TaxID=112413 RepID=A0A1I5ZFL1_9PSEU|nr:LuxR C-terminal-related transcriptional regulator [Amycolatopsis rubida]SFQ55173.1 non-specific serine/threonine protein kinase [Amycolatopsis rubida]
MRGNLPADITTFVGRGAEVREIRRLMRQSRMVTLIGVGGVGKTRLARAVAADLGRAFDAGVWLVDLTPLTSPDLLESAIRDVLPAAPGTGALWEQIGRRGLLLELDNCDHLASEVGPVITELLLRCPGMRALITSRSSLGVSGEQVYEVAPLGVRATGAELSEAATLFRDRVRALDSTTTVDFAAPEVTELCSRLDGLPLAIELAALRTRALSITEILDGLQARFDLLDGGPRDLPPHHQSLRALLEWSWDQCSPAEQRLWSRLAVFSGSAPLDAVLAVADLDRRKGIRLVESLVRRSVLQHLQAGDASRYRMLDTVREFGALMLQDATEELRLRHAAYYLALADEASTAWFGPEEQSIGARVKTEIANIRTALDTALADRRHCEQAARTVAALWFYWLGCGDIDEGTLWCDKTAAALGRFGLPAPSPFLWVRGWLQLVAGDTGTARRSLTGCLEAAKREGDTRNAAYAQAFLGALHGFAGDYAAFGSCYQEAIGSARAVGDHLATAMFLVHQAEIRSLIGEPEIALRLCARSAEICQAHGDRWCLCYTLWVRALCHHVTGQAAAALERALAAAKLAMTLDDHLAAVLVSEVAAWSMVEDDAKRSAVLLAATARYWTMSGKVLLGFDRLIGHREAALAVLAEKLAPAQAEEAAAAGRALGDSGARAILAGAFDELAPAPPVVPGEPEKPKPDNGFLELLSAREREVAVLVSEGKTNQQIAHELIIGRRTIDTHVSNILAKCGLRRRAEIAALVSSSS